MSNSWTINETEADSKDIIRLLTILPYPQWQYLSPSMHTGMEDWLSLVPTA